MLHILLTYMHTHTEAVPPPSRRGMTIYILPRPYPVEGLGIVVVPAY